MLASGAAEAEALVSDLALFLGEARVALGAAGAVPALERRVQSFPAWDVPAFEPVSPPAAVVHDRMRTLFHLVHGRDPIVVTTPDAVMQRLLPKATVSAAMRYLVQGDEVDAEELAQHLISWGYLRVPVVEDVGEFSVRGGLIDVFTPLDAEPFRLELDGDRIESLRTFDPDTQRSSDQREEVVIIPVREASLADLRTPEARRAVEVRAIEIEMARLDRNAMSDALENGLFSQGSSSYPLRLPGRAPRRSSTICRPTSGSGSTIRPAWRARGTRPSSSCSNAPARPSKHDDSSRHRSVSR